MPYKRIGRKIYTKRTGTWKLKQTCTSIHNAKSALRLLNQIEAKTMKKIKRTPVLTKTGAYIRLNNKKIYFKTEAQLRRTHPEVKLVYRRKHSKDYLRAMRLYKKR
ncbi:MAG: hypothetical protein DRN66_03740 [Candidatus Nanohalarchaeota archaeon]|nr:MAG: hypothetical protein DRN66_03740 [Candidatus Nanohaloarchaeota archaeon]